MENEYDNLFGNCIAIKNELSDYSELQVAVLKATRKILHKDKEKIKAEFEDWMEKRTPNGGLYHFYMYDFKIAEIADIVYGKRKKRTVEQLRAIWDTFYELRGMRKGISYESDIFPIMERETNTIMMEGMFLNVEEDSDPSECLSKLENLLGAEISVRLKDWIFL